MITPPSLDPEKYFDDDDETSTSTGPVTLPLDENSPPGTLVGTMFAWDGDLGTLTYTLGGTDIDAFNEHFEYDDETGEITVGEGVVIDHETRASYAFTISVSDGEDDTGDSQATSTVDATVDLTIEVINLNEEGVVTLAPESPSVHVDVTASLEDDDGSVSGESWRWSKADSADGPFTDIGGATSPTYAPVLADRGSYLRATVTYTDHHGADQSAELTAGRPDRSVAAGRHALEGGPGDRGGRQRDLHRGARPRPRRHHHPYDHRS